MAWRSFGSHSTAGSATPGLVADIIETAASNALPHPKDLSIRYADLRDGVLTGSVTAIDVDAAYDPELLVACISEDGSVSDYTFTPLQPRRIDPYRTIPFRIAMPAGGDRLLAAATAHR